MAETFAQILSQVRYGSQTKSLLDPIMLALPAINGYSFIYRNG